MNWNENLPDVTSWQPTQHNDETLKQALEVTCQVAQRRIVSGSQAEVLFNIFNYDSGLGVEDIVRQEFTNLLPHRYSVDFGVISCRHGRNAGDCDLIIRDRSWSPAVKLGAIVTSRRCHFPIEGVYAVAEISQGLGFQKLDNSMKKLVTLSRLDRPENPYGHITENQHLEYLDQTGKILNPLHTSIFAVGLQGGLTFRDLAMRFGAINSMLTRDEMIKMLCVLDHGTAWYSVESGSPYNADYMTDRQSNLVLQINTGEPENAFYRFYVELLGHLNRSVLGLTNVATEYGNPPPPREVHTYTSAVFNGDAQ